MLRNSEKLYIMSLEIYFINRLFLEKVDLIQILKLQLLIKILVKMYTLEYN